MVSVSYMLQADVHENAGSENSQYGNVGLPEVNEFPKKGSIFT